MESITAITPTVCRLMGIGAPALARGEPLETVLRAAEEIGIDRVEKILLYLPDAIGVKSIEAYPEIFEPIPKYAPLTVDLRSVVPPKTPVCFASMFTGGEPEEHGIRMYEKPVLRCDTLFDALLRAGKKAVIAGAENCSMNCIFRERKMDYFSERYDAEVIERAKELIRSDRYDVITVYQQEYDDTLHRTTPTSAEAVEAMRHHVENFVTLAKLFFSHNEGVPAGILFSPDHGGHVDEETGKGTHGVDIPEDMLIRHYFGFSAKGRSIV